MGVIVRLANLERDRRVIIELVARYLNARSTELRYEWMYLKNPNGPARVWLAEDGSDGRVVGMASAFPRRMVYRGHDILGWVLGDFCIAEGRRTLGPAMQLQRAIVDDVNSGMADLFYDFPSRAMMAVYRRLGIDYTRELVRFTKLLRIDGWTERAISGSYPVRAISKAGNVVLRLLDSVQTGDRSISVDEVVGHEVGEEYGHVWTQAEEQFGLCVRRSAQYLSWRYLQNPGGVTTMLAARRNGKLLGFSVAAQEGRSALLLDCVVGGDQGAAKAMLRTMSAQFRDQGLERLDVSTFPGTWWANQLAGLGFVPRESSPVVAYLSTQARNRFGPLDMQWVVMPGDRDC